MLVIQHKLANRIGELFALPAAFEFACALLSARRRSRTHRLDRIRRCAQFMSGYMRNQRRLSRSVGGKPRRTGQLPCRSVGVTSCRARLGHFDLAPHPRSNHLNRLSGPRVVELRLFKIVQNVLCAIGRPKRQQPVIGIRECAPSTNGDEAGVTLLR